MIERDSWGHSYLIVRGEILVRKHLPSLISAAEQTGDCKGALGMFVRGQ